MIPNRELTELDDLRLVYRGNKLLGDLFRKGVSCVRQLCINEAEAKGAYRFLYNDRVSEDDLVNNLATNCVAACKGKYVICIQDTSEVNLINHQNRLKKDDYVGTTNANNTNGLGFFLHPSLVLDAEQGIPYGYADVKLWNRSLEFQSKHERRYKTLPIEEKDSYKWLEVSRNTQARLKDVVAGMVIVQDREGDIYEQYASLPDEKTALLIRACRDRILVDNTRLFSCLSTQGPQGNYEVTIEAKNGRKKRVAQLEVRYKPVTLRRPEKSSKYLAPTVDLYLIEAREVNYRGNDAICWRLLTTVPIENVEMAMQCIEWYSWRWTIEEVFKILKKEGYNVEASELELASSVRKLCLLVMEVVIKLFLMRLAYAEPETEIEAATCFTEEEQQFLEDQIVCLEGRTEKQKNPFKQKDLKRYVWAIARLGGWKGYESKRHPGITTLWIGLTLFKASFQGWLIHRNVSTR